MRKSERGTCPTCGKRYLIKHNGCIRRHNGPAPKCFTSDQLPREILAAILVIARMEEDDGDGSEPNNIPG